MTPEGCLYLPQGLYMYDHYCSIISETVQPIEAKLYVEPSLEGGGDIYLHYKSNLGHVTKMAAMPIYMYGKTLKNVLLLNQVSDCI